jgi:hypothetical protein
MCALAEVQQGAWAGPLLREVRADGTIMVGQPALDCKKCGPGTPCDGHSYVLAAPIRKVSRQELESMPTFSLWLW